MFIISSNTTKSLMNIWQWFSYLVDARYVKNWNQSSLFWGYTRKFSILSCHSSSVSQPIWLAHFILISCISLNFWHKSDKWKSPSGMHKTFSGIYRFNILTVYCALPPTFNDGALTPRISLAGTLARLPKRSRIVSNSSRQMVRFSKAKFRPVTEFTAISFPLYRLIILRKFSFVPTFYILSKNITGYSSSEGG